MLNGNTKSATLLIRALNGFKICFLIGIETTFQFKRATEKSIYEQGMEVETGEPQ